MDGPNSSSEEDLTAVSDADLILAVRAKLPQEQIINNVTKYLNDGAHINYQNSKGNTILHIAIEKGYLEVVKFLLTLRARADIPNKSGQTAADLGKSSSNKSIQDLFNKI
ncbi:hypothetical protein NQ318_005279 [Aromia moschata]|uniref:Uncharacterized protein n=1 Tax=Aromia moschata TaxID=1265417 RepID=A0AAV8Y1X9_9CUCU|nr:hypothetical protein NQ318_005279 [Aromia moschata]